MDVLVLSDSHGHGNFIDRIICNNENCKTIFFLGDGLRDILPLTEKYPDRKFISVSGNCDLYSNESTEAYKHLEGVTIMACHGHTLGVKLHLRELINKADSVMAHLVLYGHTHRQDMYNDAATGICAVNPGAVCNGKYCVITLKKGTFDIIFKDIYNTD